MVKFMLHQIVRISILYSLTSLRTFIYFFLSLRLKDFYTKKKKKYLTDLIQMKFFIQKFLKCKRCKINTLFPVVVLRIVLNNIVPAKISPASPWWKHAKVVYNVRESKYFHATYSPACRSDFARLEGFMHRSIITSWIRLKFALERCAIAASRNLCSCRLSLILQEPTKRAKTSVCVWESWRLIRCFAGR